MVRKTGLLVEGCVVVNRRVLYKLDPVVAVWMEADDRLKLVAVDAGDLPDNSDLDILAIVLRDRHVGRRMVFLVAHQDVRHQRALARQKRNRKLNGLSVPVLAVLSLIFYTANRFVKLMQEPELCAHAEVGDSKETKLFKDEFAGKLNLDGCR